MLIDDCRHRNYDGTAILPIPPPLRTTIAIMAQTSDRSPGLNGVTFRLSYQSTALHLFF